VCSLKRSVLIHVFDHINVNNFDVAPKEKQERLKEIASSVVQEGAYFPIVLTLQNKGQTGLRNLYIQLEISSNINGIDISKSPKASLLRKLSHWITSSNMVFIDSDHGTARSDIMTSVKEKLSIFETDKLHKSEGTWQITIEWDALQAQRVRLIEPVIYVYTPRSCTVAIKAKVFADSFSEPFVLEVSAKIEANQRDVSVIDVIPNWEEALARDTNSKITLFDQITLSDPIKTDLRDLYDITSDDSLRGA
jgi:hypothetical protein